MDVKTLKRFQFFVEETTAKAKSCEEGSPEYVAWATCAVKIFDILKDDLEAEKAMLEDMRRTA